MHAIVILLLAHDIYRLLNISQHQVAMRVVGLMIWASASSSGCSKIWRATDVEPSPELSVATKLHKDLLVEGQADEVERLGDSGSIVGVGHRCGVG